MFDQIKFTSPKKDNIALWTNYQVRKNVLTVVKCWRTDRHAKLLYTLSAKNSLWKTPQNPKRPWRLQCTMGGLQKNVINWDVCHLREGEAKDPYAFTVEYVDAAMTIVLQRCPNSQIIETIDIDIRQCGKRGAKPSLFGFVPSQHYRTVRLAVDILTGVQGQEDRSWHLHRKFNCA